MAGAALGAPSYRSAEVWRRVKLLGAASICVAGAALGASPARFAWQAQHLEHLRLVLRGRRSTWSISGSFCRAGAALEASQLHIARHFFKAQTSPTPPSTLHLQTHHHQDNTIYTTPSTLHHQHNTIYTTSSNTTSSTQLHQHITIYKTPSTQHHQTVAGAALGALPYYPFCLIPTDSLWIVLCSVSLTYSTVGCPKTLLSCGVSRSYNFEVFCSRVVTVG